MVHAPADDGVDVRTDVGDRLARYGGDEVGGDRPPARSGAGGGDQDVERVERGGGVVGAAQEAQHLVGGRLDSQAEPVEAQVQPGRRPGRG